MAAGGVKIVFDEHFSRTHVDFVRGQSALGQLVHTRTMGWSGVRDDVWIPIANGLNFVIVSADRNDNTRGFTVEDLKAMGARVILVGPFWDHLSRWEKAKWLVAYVERLHYIAQALTSGSVTLIVSCYCQFRAL